MTANTSEYTSDFCGQKQILACGFESELCNVKTMKCRHWGHRQTESIKPRFNFAFVILQYAQWMAY